ncbi:transmembrane efflux protein [Streptomyces lincolnensis]|uniref:Transmembrane efflux protein n=1 Tax=Streptomyces lincolnensis TaxID=1915 RepID=A0A1B1MFB6_STRLN|nr:transmembrane efflux protein [Streptomyces lincolnensis]AXG56074.1 transmembrane efflux protein [Streptomyces lincolnensis]
MGNPMDRRAWALLLVLCGTIFLEGADIAMMAVAIPSIRSDLGLATGTAAWVLSGYVLGYAGFTLLGGRAADLLGRRRMFLTWLTVFLVFSGLGGFATEGWMLVVARFVTGVAAAFMTPAALSLITTSYEQGPQREKALLVFAGTGAGGFSLGLVIGGLLTELDWRWVFFAPVLLAGALLLAAVRVVPRQEAPPFTRRGFDLPGAITAAGAMLLAAYAVVRLEHGLHDWPLTLAAGLVALLLLAAFLAVERRSAAPLVRLGILRTGSVVRADLGALLFLGAFFGFQFVVTLYLQELRGWSAVQTAIALVIMGCDAVLAPTLTPWLVTRFGNARVIVGGFALAVVAYGLFLPVGMDWPYLAMLPTLFVAGLAFALAYGPLTIMATEGVVDAEQGLAGGLLHTATQFGSAIGISAVTAVYGLAAGEAGGSDPDATLSAFRTALTVPVGMVLLGLVLSLLNVRAARRAVRSASQVSSVSASQTSAKPAQRSGGMASR